MCVFICRWVPKESKHSLNKYIAALKNSDLTMHPVGKNTECYRMYEALSFGTVPVVEDVMTPGICQGPLRLMKLHKAPFIFIKNWKDISNVMKKELLLNYSQIVQRREEVVKWYKEFKENICSQFIKLIHSVFFN